MTDTVSTELQSSELDNINNLNDEFIDESSLELGGVLPEINIDDLSAEYDKIILLPKKDLSNVCRIVEDYCKTSVDDYGKSVRFHSVADNLVEVSFVSNAIRVRQVIESKSATQIKDFCISISLLKRICTVVSSVVPFIEKDDKIYLSICGEPLEIDTIPLNFDSFNIECKEVSTPLDVPIAQHTLSILEKIFFTADKSSEKIAFFKGDNAMAITSVFLTKLPNPFVGDSFVLQKSDVKSILIVLSSHSHDVINYGVFSDSVVLQAGSLYVETILLGQSQVQQLWNPLLDTSFTYTPNVSLVNDIFNNVFKVVNSFEYLSSLCTMSWKQDMVELVLKNDAQVEKSRFAIKYISGTPTVEGDVIIDAKIAGSLFDILGNDCLYDNTPIGLVVNSNNRMLILRSR